MRRRGGQVKRIKLRDQAGNRAYRRVHVRIIPGGLLPEESRSFHKQGMIYNATGIEQILDNVTAYIEAQDRYKGTEFRMVEVGRGKFNFIGMSTIEAEEYAAREAASDADHTGDEGAPDEEGVGETRPGLGASEGSK